MHGAKSAILAHREATFHHGKRVEKWQPNSLKEAISRAYKISRTRPQSLTVLAPFVALSGNIGRFGKCRRRLIHQRPSPSPSLRPETLPLPARPSISSPSSPAVAYPVRHGHRGVRLRVPRGLLCIQPWNIGQDNVHLATLRDRLVVANNQVKQLVEQRRRSRQHALEPLGGRRYIAGVDLSDGDGIGARVHATERAVVYNRPRAQGYGSRAYLKLSGSFASRVGTESRVWAGSITLIEEVGRAASPSRVVKQPESALVASITPMVKSARR